MCHVSYHLSHLLQMYNVNNANKYAYIHIHTYTYRCGMKKLGDREKRYVHMLNATLCATGRAICCLLETYQEHDGVRVPEVLIPFMGGITFMPFIRDAKVFKDQQQHDKEKDNKDKEKVLVVTKPVAATTTTTTTTTVVAASSEASAASVSVPTVEQITDKLDSITLPTPPSTSTTKSDGKTEKKKGGEKVEAKKVVVVVGDVEAKKVVGDVDISQPPTVPILPPLYTTPAPSNKKVS